MSKKVSNNQRIINFGLESSEGELNFAIESLITIRASRFPKAPKAAPKKVRSDKGTTRKVNNNPLPPLDGSSILAGPSIAD